MSTEVTHAASAVHEKEPLLSRVDVDNDTDEEEKTQNSSHLPVAISTQDELLKWVKPEIQANSLFSSKVITKNSNFDYDSPLPDTVRTTKWGSVIGVIIGLVGGGAAGYFVAGETITIIISITFPAVGFSIFAGVCLGALLGGCLGAGVGYSYGYCFTTKPIEKHREDLQLWRLNNNDNFIKKITEEIKGVIWKNNKLNSKEKECMTNIFVEYLHKVCSYTNIYWYSSAEKNLAAEIINDCVSQFTVMNSITQAFNNTWILEKFSEYQQHCLSNYTIFTKTEESTIKFVSDTFKLLCEKSNFNSQVFCKQAQLILWKVKEYEINTDYSVNLSYYDRAKIDLSNDDISYLEQTLFTCLKTACGLYNEYRYNDPWDSFTKVLQNCRL